MAGMGVSIQHRQSYRLESSAHPLQVYCNGEEVLVTSGTKAKYTVDIWSGNHPFFKGSSNVTLVDEGSVNRFKRRYAGLDSLSDMSRIKTGAGFWALGTVEVDRS